MNVSISYEIDFEELPVEVKKLLVEVCNLNKYVKELEEE